MVEDAADHAAWTAVRPVMPRPSFLHLVTAREVAELRTALANGEIPADFEAKLNRLGEGSLSDRMIEQNCRLFIALLTSVRGGFHQASWAQRDQLLRVLAYVRKQEDAIPDYRPDGFVDDHAEVRAARTELTQLLEGFKAWRLRHQVAAMWQDSVSMCD